MKKSMQQVNEHIEQYTRELRLPSVREEFRERARQAGSGKSSYEEYLLELLESEHLARLERRKKQRIRRAGFPCRKYLEDLDVEELPAAAAEKLGVLERLDFVRTGRNVILAGNPGTGKTHTLSRTFCRDGHRAGHPGLPGRLPGVVHHGAPAHHPDPGEPFAENVAAVGGAF